MTEQTKIDGSPLVSILLPTHNRPDYFEIALKSALAQTYSNIEIIVSDNGTNDETARRIEPYLQAFNHIHYFRRPAMSPVDNWDRCFELSKGEYINYLMDDDVFLPDKITRMMACFLANPKVGIVTSFRELIDDQGRQIPNLLGTERLFSQDTLLKGSEFGRFMLVNGSNVIGEPTTAMIKRKDIPHGFGYFGGVRYKLMTDVATWLSILAHSDCIYLTNPLSYFRIHGGQDQKTQKNVQINASIEWFHFALNALDNRWFYNSTQEAVDQLTQKLPAFRQFVLDHYVDDPKSLYHLDDINNVFDRAQAVVNGRIQ
jgi:glycosyltransferase involved in cell wall biosynthesis